MLNDLNDLHGFTDFKADGKVRAVGFSEILNYLRELLDRSDSYELLRWRANLDVRSVIESAAITTFAIIKVIILIMAAFN
jgi:hypothetical protein